MEVRWVKTVCEHIRLEFYKKIIMRFRKKDQTNSLILFFRANVIMYNLRIH